MRWRWPAASPECRADRPQSVAPAALAARPPYALVGPFSPPLSPRLPLLGSAAPPSGFDTFGMQHAPWATSPSSFLPVPHTTHEPPQVEGGHENLATVREREQMATPLLQPCALRFAQDGEDGGVEGMARTHQMGLCSSCRAGHSGSGSTE